MSENLRLYTSIVFGFEHVLRLVPGDAWDAPSPCEGWNTRQVAGHTMAVVNNIAARGGVGTVVDVFEGIDAVPGDDPVTTFRQIRNRYLAATDHPGALQTMVTSRLGQMTMDEFLGRMCLDTLVHTWDLARAAGVDESLDPDAVAAVSAELQASDDHVVRAPGRYADAIAVDRDATAQDRLLAFTGRQP